MPPPSGHKSRITEKDKGFLICYRIYLLELPATSNQRMIIYVLVEKFLTDNVGQLLNGNTTFLIVFQPLGLFIIIIQCPVFPVKRSIECTPKETGERYTKSKDIEGFVLLSLKWRFHWVFKNISLEIPFLWTAHSLSHFPSKKMTTGQEFSPAIIAFS